MNGSVLLVAAFLAVLVCTLALRLLNLRHLRTHGARVPAELDGVIEPAHLERIARYTVAHTRLDIVQLVLDGLALGIFLFGGVLGSPGTTEIAREIRRQLDGGGEFAVCYADLDHFKVQRPVQLL